METNLSVSSKNITVDIFNGTVIVSGYEIINKITEFSDEDIGNYTVEMHNEFGNAMCTVQLEPHGEHYFPTRMKIIDIFQIIRLHVL